MHSIYSLWLTRGHWEVLKNQGYLALRSGFVWLSLQILVGVNAKIKRESH